MKKIISLILSMSMALSLGAGLLSGCQETKRDFKNVILVIGDGRFRHHRIAILGSDREHPRIFSVISSPRYRKPRYSGGTDFGK